MPLLIDIYSDVICPWCWIGKRRLDQAIATLTPSQAQVRWHPFQLNPGMPPEGMPRADYRRRKFGSDEYAQALDARVTKAGEIDGLAFDLAGQSRTPNTILAHRLIWLAGKHGVQDVIVEALFSAYFSAGLNIGDASTLARIAAAATEAKTNSALFAAKNISAFLARNEGEAEIQADEQSIRAQDLDGVPLFIINGKERINGAQPIAVFTAILHQMATAAPDDTTDCNDGFCRT